MGFNQEQAEKFAKEYEKDRIPIEDISFTKEGEAMRALTKEELKELDYSGEDVDPQNIPERISVYAKTFVDKHMESYLDKIGQTKTERLSLAVKFNQKWRELIYKHKGAKTNPGQDMIDYISYVKFSKFEV